MKTKKIVKYIIKANETRYQRARQRGDHFAYKFENANALNEIREIYKETSKNTTFVSDVFILNTLVLNNFYWNKYKDELRLNHPKNENERLEFIAQQMGLFQNENVIPKSWLKFEDKDKFYTIENFSANKFEMDNLKDKVTELETKLNDFINENSDSKIDDFDDDDAWHFDDDDDFDDEYEYKYEDKNSHSQEHADNEAIFKALLHDGLDYIAKSTSTPKTDSTKEPDLLTLLNNLEKEFSLENENSDSKKETKQKEPVEPDRFEKIKKTSKDVKDDFSELIKFARTLESEQNAEKNIRELTSDIEKLLGNLNK